VCLGHDKKAFVGGPQLKVARKALAWAYFEAPLLKAKVLAVKGLVKLMDERVRDERTR
jgi:hypothetical protein